MKDDEIKGISVKEQNNGGSCMKRTVLAGLSLGLLLSGCATEDYVKQQMTPMNERLGALEQKVNNLDGKIGQPVKVELSPEDRKALDDASNMSKKALDDSDRIASDMKRAESAAGRAEEAAKRAEESAGKAEQAGKKSEKIFKLEQKK